MPKPISAQNGKTLEEIEVLTANYPISVADGEIKLAARIKMHCTMRNYFAYGAIFRRFIFVENFAFFSG